MKLLSITIGLTFLFTGCNQKKETIHKEKFEANWESLKQYETPAWFQDAKFGIYFHWGPYSVPAYKNEWYSHHMYVEGSEYNKYHIETYGSLDTFGYKDFIPMFKAEKWDPRAWAKLFKKAGAQFAGPVAEHADGFAMWDSNLTEWDAMDMGPKRDVVGEMEKAIRSEGMKFVTTFHHQWLYAWYPTMRENVDASNPEYEDLYGPAVPFRLFGDIWNNDTIRAIPKFNKRWLDRAVEVVDKYNPDMVWFDNKVHIIEEDVRTQFLSHYYNHAAARNQEVVCTYKFTDFEKGTAVLDLERSRMSDKADFPWLTDDSMDWDTWCHVSKPNYKSTNRLIDFLIDVVSKNGCVLLNITPTAEGVIPEPVEKRLLEMGEWLDMNGEAIYETRPWHIWGEGKMEIIEGHLSEHKNPDATVDDIRFTTKDGILYVIFLDWPDNGNHTIKCLGTGQENLGEINNIHLLGSDKTITWERNIEGLTIHFPPTKPCDFAYVFAIK